MHETLGMCVGKSFNLEKAVCNHGFFMMAPNRWIPSEKTLVRPLRLNDNDSTTSTTCNVVIVSIAQSPHITNFLQIKLHHHQQDRLSSHCKEAILGQVARMLRISKKDEKIVEEFQRVHPDAKKNGFGRIFRSPTIFEDMVKSVLLCYAPWKRSLEMAQALCDLQFKSSSLNGKKKRKRSSNVNCCKECDECKMYKYGNFPSPKELAANFDEESLNSKCNLGFRAAVILQLAHSIQDETMKLEDFELDEEEKVLLKLNKINGFGPFLAANMMMCLGFYRHIPFDTETIKHLNKVHGVESEKLKKKKQRENVIDEIYGKYGPFQCLTYWMEHVEYYEKVLGKLSELSPSQYFKVSTSVSN